MRRRLLAIAVVVSAMSDQAAYAAARADAKAQVEFGRAVAQKGLWREAIYRWKRAIEIDPTYAAAYNNLAVAYEQTGLLDEAKQAYQRAVALDPKNDQIRHNYESFQEIHDRAGRSDVQ